MIRREIVQIDEEKCDGCGVCAPNCEEGAIRIIDGKAKLVSDVYCDGLGACLGHCPQGAISMVERDAAPFDAAAVEAHLYGLEPEPPAPSTAGGCPGSQSLQLRVLSPSPEPACASDLKPASASDEPSRLANWPVQLGLVPPQAPFLQGADLLLVADCVPFACADFHGRFLDGRPVVIGCPKLDAGDVYVDKLARIIQTAKLQSISVLHMEVPCCTGLQRIAEAAVRMAGSSLAVGEVTISTRGEILSPTDAQG